jgi:hypothetical protein
LLIPREKVDKAPDSIPDGAALSRDLFCSRSPANVEHDRLKMNAHQIGVIPFIDGVTRSVYLNADGRQFVFDDDGKPIYGVWLHVDAPFRRRPRLTSCRGRLAWGRHESHSGVWLSDMAPMAEQFIEPFEWVEDGKNFREFLVPVALANRFGPAVVYKEE